MPVEDQMNVDEKRLEILDKTRSLLHTAKCQDSFDYLLQAVTIISEVLYEDARRRYTQSNMSRGSNAIP